MVLNQVTQFVTNQKLDFVTQHTRKFLVEKLQAVGEPIY